MLVSGFAGAYMGLNLVRYCHQISIWILSEF